MASVEYVGHATVYIELDGTAILTDPVLRPLTSGLAHRSPPSEAVIKRQIDAVLISHLHHDHLDLKSLRLLEGEHAVLIARGGAALLERHGFADARDMSPGESASIGQLRVLATRADHRGYRVPAGPSAETIGFLIEGSQRIYFAGDTDVFDEMSALQPIDLALLPIAGWGPRLGPGHMDAARAVQALQLLRPRVAIPIHWGTLAPWGMHRGSWSYLTRPASDFSEIAAREAPQVEVIVLQPGESVAISSGSPSGPRAWQDQLASS